MAPMNDDPIWKTDGESKLAAAWAHVPMFVGPLAGPILVYLFFKGKETKFQAKQAIVYHLICVPIFLLTMFGFGAIGGAVGMTSYAIFGETSLIGGIGSIVGGLIAVIGFVLGVVVLILPLNAAYYILFKGQRYNYRILGKFLRGKQQ